MHPEDVPSLLFEGEGCPHVAFTSNGFAGPAVLPHGCLQSA